MTTLNTPARIKTGKGLGPEPGPGMVIRLITGDFPSRSGDGLDGTLSSLLLLMALVSRKWPLFESVSEAAIRVTDESYCIILGR
jgi:hypothetical protein